VALRAPLRAAHERFAEERALRGLVRRDPEDAQRHLTPMLDHSATYRSCRVWHWHHRARLRQVLKEVAEFADASSVADFGCSNGYVTNLLSQVCRGEVHGFDYQPELLREARSLYPHLVFRRVDLNRNTKWKKQYELVCCFETLEHVGDLEAALRNLFGAVQRGGVLIVSVPVETGLWGVAKYCAKTLAGYPVDEITAGRVEYLRALLAGRNISVYRKERYTFGTHFGFDWREVEQAVAGQMTLLNAYTKLATRVIVARKP
jgi:2-polyprenyl-3-methyl-5-hydroxy-6-metoxy-1,4-benzoquinol methylase